MTIETQIHDYLRDRYTNPLRSNIVKASHVRTHTDADGTQAGVILSRMYDGEIGGVELSMYNNPSSGQPRYRIEHVAERLEGRFYVDAETCATIRKKIKSGRYTQRTLAEDVGVSSTQVSNHARGYCTHDVDEVPARSVNQGSNRYAWVDAPEVRG